MVDTALYQWIIAALEGNPADPIGYARDAAKAAIRGGKMDEAQTWKAVIERFQDEFAKPIPIVSDDEGPDDDSSPVS